MMKSPLVLTGSTSEERKIYLFTTLILPVFRKSLYQNKMDYLQKPISGLGRIVLPLIFFMDELSVHAALVMWYDRSSIYRQVFSTVKWARPLVRFFRIQRRKQSSQGVILHLAVTPADTYVDMRKGPFKDHYKSPSLVLEYLWQFSWTCRSRQPGGKHEEDNKTTRS